MLKRTTLEMPPTPPPTDSGSNPSMDADRAAPPTGRASAEVDPTLEPLAAATEERDRPAGRSKKGGRPKKAPSEKRTERVFVLLTPGEIAAVKRSATEAGLSVSAYARRRLLGRAVAPLVLGHQVQAAQGELVGAAGELNRVGSNLNQLARWANAGAPAEGSPEGGAQPTGSPSASEWAALAAEVRSAVAAARAASEGLARAADGGDGRVKTGGPVYVRRDPGSEDCQGAEAP